MSLPAIGQNYNLLHKPDTSSPKQMQFMYIYIITSNTSNTSLSHSVYHSNKGSPSLIIYWLHITKS